MQIENYTVDDVTGCWNWNGALNDDGYAQATVKADTPSGLSSVKIHRLSYEKCKGPIPAGLMHDHKCRNRRCINPDHLEAVTNAENVRRGKSAKLTKVMAQEIRLLYAVGDVSQGALAARFKVSEPVVYKIVHGKAWIADMEDVVLPPIRRQGRRQILNKNQEREIFTRRSAGEKLTALAREFGISVPLASRIANEKTNRKTGVS